MSLIIKAKAEKDLWKNEKGYRITAFSPVGKFDGLILNNSLQFICKGNHAIITIGRVYELELEAMGKDQYGVAYNIISVPSIDKQDFRNLKPEEAFDIVMDCTSSERIASNILSAYPNFVEIVLTEGREAIDTKNIYGVGESYMKCYERILLEKYKYYHIAQKFKEYKIDTNDCKELLIKYKDENGINVALKDNPYFVSTEVLYRDFGYSDNMIVKNRPDLEDSKIRCEALMIHILKMNENDSSTRLNGNYLYRYMRDEFNTPQLLPYVKEVALESNMIYYDEKSKDLSLMSTYMAECKIADFIKEKLSKNTVLDWDWEKFKKIKDGELTEEQSNVLRMICEKDVVILNAPAGCGKTSTLLSVLEMIEHYNKTYKCVAFTGKASKRMIEQTNRPATTIHRACLGDAVINQDFLIIDEDSMLSLDLVIMLINAIENENIKILFVGDSFQIPSINKGRFIKDLIECGKVPLCSLSHCFRFGKGGILTVATMIRNGEEYLSEIGEKDRLFLGENKDYEFIKSDGTIEQITYEYQKLLNKGVKPENICVLTPHNVNEFGTINLNNHLQLIANPPTPHQKFLSTKIGQKEIAFRVKDIVMNTKNNYNAITNEGYDMIEQSRGKLSRDEVSTCTIFNGEMGKVLEVTDKVLKVKFDENIVVFDKSELGCLLLFYSSNPYKMQGSQADWVINITMSNHQRSLNNQLLYTSITRAKLGVKEIGEVHVVNETIMKQGDDTRNTWLKELMEDEN